MRTPDAQRGAHAPPSAAAPAAALPPTPAPAPLHLPAANAQRPAAASFPPAAAPPALSPQPTANEPTLPAPGAEERATSAAHTAVVATAGAFDWALDDGAGDGMEDATSSSVAMAFELDTAADGSYDRDGEGYTSAVGSHTMSADQRTTLRQLASTPRAPTNGRPGATERIAPTIGAASTRDGAAQHAEPARSDAAPPASAELAAATNGAPATASAATRSPIEPAAAALAAADAPPPLLPHAFPPAVEPALSAAELAQLRTVDSPDWLDTAFMLADADAEAGAEAQGGSDDARAALRERLARRGGVAAARAAPCLAQPTALAADMSLPWAERWEMAPASHEDAVCAKAADEAIESARRREEEARAARRESDALEARISAEADRRALDAAAARERRAVGAADALREAAVAAAAALADEERALAERVRGARVAEASALAAQRERDTAGRALALLLARLGGKIAPSEFQIEDGADVRESGVAGAHDDEQSDGGGVPPSPSTAPSSTYAFDAGEDIHPSLDVPPSQRLLAESIRARFAQRGGGEEAQPRHGPSEARGLRVQLATQRRLPQSHAAAARVRLQPRTPAEQRQLDERAVAAHGPVGAYAAEPTAVKRTLVARAARTPATTAPAAGWRHARRASSPPRTAVRSCAAWLGEAGHACTAFTAAEADPNDATSGVRLAFPLAQLLVDAGLDASEQPHALAARAMRVRAPHRPKQRPLTIALLRARAIRLALQAHAPFALRIRGVRGQMARSPRAEGKVRRPHSPPPPPNRALLSVRSQRPPALKPPMSSTRAAPDLSAQGEAPNGAVRAGMPFSTADFHLAARVQHEARMRKHRGAPDDAAWWSALANAVRSRA